MNQFKTNQLKIDQLKTLVQQGVWKNNSALVQLLGLCPLLAVSTSVTAALGLGLATTGVLMATNFSISLLRHRIPHPIRIPIFVLIIASQATTVQLLMHAFAFQLYQSLGLFIPLIVTNCIVIGRAEAFAAKQPLIPSTVDGLAMGLGATTTLLLLGSLREIVGTGSLLKNADQLFGPWAQKLQLDIMPLQNPFLLAILPPGAFLGLGLLLALKQRIDYAVAQQRQCQQAQRLIPVVVTMTDPHD